jgi:glycine/D-amino acid oxidase-like deaminating enzyme
MTTHPSHERPCGWNALLPPRAPASPARGDLEADYLVIGAGYTGLAAARTRAEARPDERVLVLDADAVGEGSPGRNSGFLLEIALAEDADASGVERMAEMNMLTRRTLARLEKLVGRHAIDCAFARRGTYRAAASARGARAIDAYRCFLQAAGLAHEVLDRAELARRLGTHHYQVGLHSPDCALVQPAALVRGLADALPDSVTIHEHSPVRRLERDRTGGWIAHTDEARVRTPCLLLANNGWAGALAAGARRVTPVYTFAALTEPLPGGLPGDDPEWGLLPAVKLGCTLRRTRDNRILIRSRYSYRRETPNDLIEAQLRDSLARRWPELARTPFAHVWGGSTGVTLGGAPVLGELQPGCWAAAGCNGGGVVKGSLFGEQLARAALGEATPDLERLFGRADAVPGEPWRSLGFRALTGLWRVQAGAEA